MRMFRHTPDSISNTTNSKTKFLVPFTWIEHVASPLPRECSTTELKGHIHCPPANRLRPATKNFLQIGAGEGNRTLVISLEGFCSTIELHPQGPHLSHAQFTFFPNLPGGGGWIRTSVLVRGQIYSLLPLTTRPPLRREPQTIGESLHFVNHKMRSECIFLRIASIYLSIK